MDKNITENEKIKINKTLSSKEYVLTKNSEPQISQVSKEEAASQFIQATGEDFVEFLGENPLRDAMIVKIQSDYQDSEKMAVIKQEIENISGVFEVTYVENLVENITSNLTKIGLNPWRSCRSINSGSRNTN